MGGGSGGGTPGTIPFNWSELKNLIPSVSQGPYNAANANTNEQWIQDKYPWIHAPAGNMQGAVPGNYPSIPGTPSETSQGMTPPPKPTGLDAFLAMLGQNKQLPAPFTTPSAPSGYAGGTTQASAPPAPMAPNTASTSSPMGLGGSGSMQPNQLQAILAALKGNNT